MTDSTSMTDWIDQADSQSSKQYAFAFPPKNPVLFARMVKAAWHSFRYLQGKRRSKAHRGKPTLACAEHFAFARVVTCAGGVIYFPVIVSQSLAYQVAKKLFEKVGLLQEFATFVSQGNTVATPASVDQLTAAIDGAEEGLRLRYKLSRLT